MILRAIEVRACRSLKESVRIELDPELVNVLHGRNGTGKTTLVSAIARGFLENYSTSAAAAREMIPWGTTLTPEINLEFEVGGKSFRLEKRFFKKKSALLSVWNGGRWSPQHEDDGAEQKLRALMHASAGGSYSQSGLAGLGQVLWSVQGELPLGKVDQSVADLVRQSFAVQSESPEARGLFETIEKFRRRFWADTREQLKTGKDAPELVSLRTRAKEKSTELDRWREEYAKADKLRGEVAAADGKLQELSEDVRKRATERDRLAQDLVKFSGIRAELEALEPKRKLAEKEFAELEKHIRRIQALEPEIAEIRNLRAELEPRWSAALQTEKDAAAEWMAVSEGKEVTARLQKLREEAAALKAPRPVELERLRSLSAKRRELEVSLDSALLHVEFEPERAAEIRVVEGEPAGTLSLEPGVKSRVSGSPRIVIEAPGLGTIRVSGPKASVDEIRTELRTVQRTLEEVSAPFGTLDVEELARRNSLTQQLESDVREVEAQWRTAQANAAARKAGAEKERSALESRRSELERQLQEKERELTDLRSDGKSLDERQARLVQLSMDGKALQESARRLKQDLEVFPDRLEEVAAAADSAGSRAAKALDSAKTESTRQRATLDQMLAAAPYERLEEAEEELKELERQIAQEQLRADAALLLHKTAAACREKAKSGAGEPLGRRATEYLSRIVGRPFGAIRISDDMAPRELLPQDAEDAVTLQHLSGGEMEQVHLATRLALARVLSEEERQLVVLDDVLTATDDDRLGRILEIVEELRPRLQFLVMTCHRERYANLPKVRFIDLEAAISGRTAP